jgi:hypothetical protein
MKEVVKGRLSKIVHDSAAEYWFEIFGSTLPTHLSSDLKEMDS